MKTMAALCALAILAGGCRVIEVENRGQAIARGPDGSPVLVDGRPVTLDQGWSVYHNSHWMATKADSLTAEVADGRIAFALNGLGTEPSEQLGVVIDKSLAGVALLAQKVGAAIATGGGSVATDAAKGAIAKAIGEFVARGGDPEKATVACEGGSCTITDGAVTETCAGCVNQ